MTKHRRDARKDARKTPLVLLAGLPHPICGAVANTTENNLVPSHRVIFQASGADNNSLYRVETVRRLLRAVSEYSLRQVKADKEVISPAQILLAYVPAADDERLLTEFDFFVFPVPLTRLANYDQYGRQYRHDRKVAEEYVVASLHTALRSFSEIKRRLSSPSWKEPLVLPPRNFNVSGTEHLADVFREIRRAARPWESALSTIQTKKVTHDELPVHIRKGVSKEVLSDSRSLLFPPDRTNHGIVRELDADSPDEERADYERKQFMRSSFRFGVPLIDGFHHDVQYGGQNLGGEAFECSRRGVVQLKCAYANVYPNDFVRPSNE
jgi:hypothetical protein